LACTNFCGFDPLAVTNDSLLTHDASGNCEAWSSAFFPLNLDELHLIALRAAKFKKLRRAALVKREATRLHERHELSFQCATQSSCGSHVTRFG
jgi:hypothetical protein